jgi:hypothetical protein
MQCSRISRPSPPTWDNNSFAQSLNTTVFAPPLPSSNRIHLGFGYSPRNTSLGVEYVPEIVTMDGNWWDPPIAGGNHGLLASEPFASLVENPPFIEPLTKTKPNQAVNINDYTTPKRKASPIIENREPKRKASPAPKRPRKHKVEIILIVDHRPPNWIYFRPGTNPELGTVSLKELLKLLGLLNADFDSSGEWIPISNAINICKQLTGPVSAKIKV